ncbi:hypothetical protein QAD02_010160 [Eretmocerus hayati]|uniref:Uncharacterized protein n=1 Tax=Eretmocerus hayati TaxID=131215 RepID=A0ACC2NBN5_9HYME|nr:hypothetical protein QAD02_010160 [Eretmocerus hayati]
MIPRSEEDWKNYQRLKSAIRHGNVEEAKLLIQKDAPLNVRFPGPRSYHRTTPLHLAVHHGSLDLIKILLDKGAHVHALSDFFESPLVLSVRLQRFGVTDLLLTVDDLKDLDYPPNRMSHLHIACLRNNIIAVKKLIAQGANVNIMVESESLHWAGYTPLHFAVENHNPDVVKLLLKSGAKMMVKNSRSLTPLHLANIVRDEVMIDILLAAQLFELGNPKDSSGLSHFHIACTRNNTEVVEFFLKQGCYVNSQVSDQSSRWKDFEPIMFAIYYECPDVVELLLRRGANLTNRHDRCRANLTNYYDLYHFKTSQYGLDELDDEGHLKLAYEIGNQKIIEMLLNAKAIKQKKMSPIKKLSEFQLDCLRKDVKEMRRWLVMAKEEIGDLKIPMWSGCTALHYLVRCFPKGTMDYFEHLSESISIKDSRGKTPLHIFFEYRYLSVEDMYLKMYRKWILSSLMDFEKNPSDLDGLTHLHIACTTNEIDWIEQFLKNGANINSTVGDSSPQWAGYTPLHFAAKYRQTQMVDVLLKNGAKISAKNRIGLTPFDIAVLSLNDRSDYKQPIWDMIRKMLLHNMTSDDEFDSRGFSIRHIVRSTTKKSSPDVFKYYTDDIPDDIDQAIDFPASKYHRWTPLHFSARNFINDVTKWLIEKGANIHLKNYDGYSSLEAEFDSPESGCILKNNPALLCVPGNPFDDRGYSYFHYACILGYRKTIEYYLQSGVDINLRTKVNDDGCFISKTCLHLVVGRKGVIDDIKYLIDNGADVNARDAYQNTPLHCMMYSHYDEKVAQLLVDNGADVNAQNFLGETPLFRACQGSGNLKGIEFLLKNGADINIATYRNETSLTYLSGELIKMIRRVSDEMMMPLLKHVKILITIGMPVSTKNRNEYLHFAGSRSPNFNERQLQEECLKEIQLMKDVRINQQTTVYDIISKTPNDMAYFFQNSSFQDLIRSDDFALKFPLYGYLIKLQSERGRHRKRLLEKCKIFFQLLANISAESSERIMDHLNDSDLKNIIACGKVVSFF